MDSEAFALLTPDVVLEAVESAFGIRLSGVVTPFASNVNRVYGLSAEDGAEYVAKFYRPGRWSEAAILDEHEFLADCHEADLPVVAPLADEERATLAGVDVDSDRPDDDPSAYLFAVFPKRAGRTFDAEGDHDWHRLGSLMGRLHLVAARREPRNRVVCRPDRVTRRLLAELHDAGIGDSEEGSAWYALAEEALEEITPLFAGATLQRIHGDCHRGNILDRGEEGLLLIDFDDMMVGPPVQDLWLLLPERRADSGRELTMLLEGYETWRPFDRRTLDLIEPLRLMRIVYFLAWQARQRHDRRFRAQNPEWGNAAFWIKEFEDLAAQRRAIAEERDARLA